MIDQEVLDFIKGFKEVKDFFLFGYCYWFAVILELETDAQSPS